MTTERPDADGAVHGDSCAAPDGRIAHRARSDAGPDRTGAEQAGGLRVPPEEDGSKLLRFLERRLDPQTPRAMLHKWIRSGQVRVNGARVRPFSRLARGDLVRVPPFVLRSLAPEPEKTPDRDIFLGPDLPVLARTEDLLVICKPGGLAVHPGTGVRDSVVDRLHAAFAGRVFVPAPVHRLDRHTSGLLLVGLTHAALQRLHEQFAHGLAAKEYLAWAAGRWPHAEPVECVDFLAKQRAEDGRELVTRSAGGREARSVVRLVFHREEQGCPPASLLHISLVTGRTHQIRVQLALRGHPVIGDGRHGGPLHTPMLLHAFRLSLPDGTCHVAPPAWPAPYDLATADLPHDRALSSPGHAAASDQARCRDTK